MTQEEKQSSMRGGWTACWFVLGHGMFEHIGYDGVSSNLLIYLTKKLHIDTTAAATSVTNWVGTIWMAPILGVYFAEAILGQYWTFVIASIIYLMGMLLLTLSVSVHGLKPPSCADPSGHNCEKASTLQLAVFFVALYTLAAGTSGTKPIIATIGADQFNEFDAKEKSQRPSFFNWWMFSRSLGTLFASTILVYIQDNVGWSLGYGLPTGFLAISILFFLAGTPFYRLKDPTGNPFTRLAQVIAAALRKWSVSVPTDPKELYELDDEENGRKGKVRIVSTSSMRFLNKACTKTNSTSPWMLCSVTQVEETKQMLRMIPILIATFVPSTVGAQVNTLFHMQGTTLNRQIDSFIIPPSNLAGFVTISMLVSVVLYDRFFVKIVRKWTKNPRGISLLQRMGIGMVLHIIIMTSLTERYRLHVSKDHGMVKIGNEVPLSIFILMGTASAFFEVAKIEFFYDQAPENMKSLGTSYSMTSKGVGSSISSFILSTVSHITKNHGHEWIQNNLNVSHLDYYYASFAVLNILNFMFFLIMTKFYVYKTEVSYSVQVLTEENTHEA